MMPIFRVSSPLSCVRRTRRHSVPVWGLAHVAGTKCICSGDQLPWPNTATKGTAPTPYDKHGFHVISASTRCSQPSHLERYRSVVAAHTILSEPSKHATYDWKSGGKNASSYDWVCEQHSRQQRAKDPAWNYPSHSKGAEDTQKPVLVGHGAFALCFLLIAAVGGYGQAARAGSSGDAVVGQRDLMHAHISKDLERTKQMTFAFDDREQRIQDFVRRREAVLQDQEACGFPPQEICSHSGDSKTVEDLGY